MELLAQTMKATYGRLTESVEDARRRAARGASMEQVRRVVSGVTVAGGPATVGTPRPGPSVVLHGADASDGPVDALTALRRARFAGEELEAVSAGEP